MSFRFSVGLATATMESNDNNQPVSPLPPGWSLHKSKKNGNPYFFNKSTRASVWNLADIPGQVGLRNWASEGEKRDAKRKRLKGTNEVETSSIEAEKNVRSELVEIEIHTLQKRECEKDLRIRTDVFANRDIQFACPESSIADQNNVIETELSKREENKFCETESQTEMSVDEKWKIKIPHSEYYEKKTKKEDEEEKEYSEYTLESFPTEDGKNESSHHFLGKVEKTKTEADTLEYFETTTESLIKPTVKEEQANRSFWTNMKKRKSRQTEANSTQEEDDISVLFESKGKGSTLSRTENREYFETKNDIEVVSDDEEVQEILEIPHKPDKKEIIRRGKTEFVMKYKSTTNAGEYEDNDTAMELRQMEMMGLPTVLQLGKGRMAMDHNSNVHLKREKTLYCTPCKLRLNSEDTMKSHLNGKKHMKKMLSLTTNAKVKPWK